LHPCVTPVQVGLVVVVVVVVVVVICRRRCCCCRYNSTFFPLCKGLVRNVSSTGECKNYSSFVQFAVSSSSNAVRAVSETRHLVFSAQWRCQYVNVMLTLVLTL